jgi:AraC-like DNA-binding protein
LASQKNRKELYKNAIVINPDTITSNNVDKNLINNALDQIEKNLGNPAYSVEQLSRDLHMDRTGLYRKLSVIVGQTPSDFMRSVRLKRAAQLLENGLTVSEVAEKVGFGTSSYFTKCFQDEFGIKPSKYKKQGH